MVGGLTPFENDAVGIVEASGTSLDLINRLAETLEHVFIPFFLIDMTDKLVVRVMVAFPDVTRWRDGDAAVVIGHTVVRTYCSSEFDCFDKPTIR